MKIIIIGDGKVGTTLIEHTSKEGHDITVVDTKADVIEKIVDSYDVMGIIGNGASYEILASAGARDADLVIAATNSDEINILSAIISKKLGAKAAISRVRNFEYNNQVDLMRKDLGIDMTINPELETANDILKIINFPASLRVESFAHGKVDIMELYVPENSPLVGKSLIQIRNDYKVNILIGAVQRAEEVYIPTGPFVINAKDKIHIISSRDNIKIFLNKIGLLENKIHDIMIIGGSRIAVYLTHMLIASKYSVKIIERDKERCKELSVLLPKAIIINGDGCDQQLLDDECIDKMDAVISLTGMDEENIIISIYANSKKVDKVIAKVDKSSFAKIFGEIGTNTFVSPKETTANRIVSYIRSKSNVHGSNIKRLYKLVNNQIEAIEFIAKETSKLNGLLLKDIKMKNDILIAAIIRNSEVIIPSGLDQILPQDSVIVITKGEILEDLDDILE